jgi:hypothetical protein
MSRGGATMPQTVYHVKGCLPPLRRNLRQSSTRGSCAPEPSRLQLQHGESRSPKVSDSEPNSAAVATRAKGLTASMLTKICHE